MDMDGDVAGVFDEPMEEALSRRYLAYALSTITARALPDVRDGLKPVHRRLLYAMRQLKLSPDLSPKKCARVVGDVIGRFHPHGDQAVYDALVRLAQDFNVRYRLVDGQGNFGNIDGDNAAAMRYTESRLTAAAALLLDGLDKNAVDFRETYDGQDYEPEVLPAGFPNLLANGASGIAVGMATSIPPHNAAELIDAATLLIDQPKADTETLMQYVSGPDFPTGGVIVEDRKEILKAYETGRGGIRLRARWHKEELSRGRWQIIVTEIPYQVQKAKLIEKLAALIGSRKTLLLADVLDESTDELRIVLEPKSRGLDPEILMETLFKLTDFETRFPVNMNALIGGVPRLVGLREALKAWLDHRRQVVVREAQHRLDAIQARLHILDGFLAIYADIEEAIRIIRFDDDPKAGLMAKFSLDEVQAEAVLNMRLRALRKLEEDGIVNEHRLLSAERDKLVKLLGSERRQWTEVKKRLQVARGVFDPSTDEGRRHTSFAKAKVLEESSVREAMILREPVTLILSEKGWVRALKGHGQDQRKIKFKEGDSLSFSLECQNTDHPVLLSSSGRAFTLDPERLPGGRSQGDPIRLFLDVPEADEIVAMFLPDDEAMRLLASDDGRGFVTPEAAMVSARKAGKQIMSVGGKARLQHVCAVSGDRVACISTGRRLVIFPLSEIPVMKSGRGVKLQNLGNAKLADIMCFNAEAGFNWRDKSGRHMSPAEGWEKWQGRRAGKGYLAPPRFNADGKFGFSD